MDYLLAFTFFGALLTCLMVALANDDTDRLV